MVSIREWEQSAAEWGRRVDEAMAAKDYDEARRCLDRAKRHAECAVKLRNEIDKAWEACERDHVAGDNPRCFSHIYFQRGYEAACTALADGGRDAD